MTQPDTKPSIIAYRKWLADAGVSNTTGWRWAKQGWIHPVNIAGRLYVTQQDIESFQSRAVAGEFAKGASGAAAQGSSKEGAGHGEEADGSAER